MKCLVSFEKKFDVVVECDSKEELERAIRNDPDLQDWCIPDEWDYLIQVANEKVDPDCGVLNNEIVHIDDYRNDKRIEKEKLAKVSIVTEIEEAPTLPGQTKFFEE